MSLLKVREVSAAFNGHWQLVGQGSSRGPGRCSRQMEHTTKTRCRAGVRLPGISGVNTREDRRNG